MTVYSEKNNIVLGITGSIACYKAAELARRYVRDGFNVRVVFSTGAEQFITPMTFSAITNNEVMTSFHQENGGGIGHIEIADWADAVVVAPASADFIAKYAHGIADNPLLAVLLATKSPVLLAPAMNVNMWEHPATQHNVEVLRSRGVQFNEPGEGQLACGWHGRGRMAEPWDIYHYTNRVLAKPDYSGKRILVVTGPTREQIDPVRFISNRSSGKMGVALAREAFRRGAEVTVIHGPVKVKLPSGVVRVPVVSAQDMHDATLAAAFPTDGQSPDIVIMAAAVSDFRPRDPSDVKL
ncbi:MAG: bifunctional phosphopantothenoylcysteine decarboxylase/phosphopantothenate--cysteine ligase CoaBC, partial [Bdellovibrionales bacterium]|nr:bifunctional phosphopantothenoylcysteine decarboxylase/phosphopantothenate--cysteine ligase CoaBC [Bdellovibrionales bacterium]